MPRTRRCPRSAPLHRTRCRTPGSPTDRDRRTRRSPLTAPLGVTTSSDTPTAHDLALALAHQIDPKVAPRDVIVSFRVRPQAAAEFGHKSSGGSATSLAQGLHAQLYGLPADPDPVPTALDALLQATYAARTGEQKAAILQRLADQLRNAAEILRGYQYEAHWERFPADVTAQLRRVHDRAEQIAAVLDHVAPAFIDAPSSSASQAPQPNRTPTVAVPASTAAPLPSRRR